MISHNSSPVQPPKENEHRLLFNTLTFRKIQQIKQTNLATSARVMGYFFEKSASFQESQVHRNIAMYCALTRKEDPRTGYVPFPRHTIARLAGTTRADMVNTGNILEDYKTNAVPEFEYIDYWHGTKSGEESFCRQIVSNGIGRIVREVAFDMDEERMYVSSLKKQSERKMEDAAQDKRKLAEEFFYRHDEQRMAGEYLNKNSTKLMRPYIKNADIAIAEAKKRDDIEGAVTIQQFKDSPEQIYVPAESRLFCARGLQFAPGYLREIMIPDGTPLDLACALFAAAARRFNMAETLSFLEEFMKGGTSPWTELSNHLLIPAHLHAEAKKDIKKAVHSLANGMNARKANKEMLAGLHSKGIQPVGNLLTHSMIREMVNSIYLAKEEIKEKGRLRGAFGDVFLMEGDGPETVIANVLQSYERSIMSAPYTLLGIRSISFTIPLDIHDEIVFVPQKEEQRDKIAQMIMDVTNKKAASYGIPTRLERGKA